MTVTPLVNQHVLLGEIANGDQRAFKQVYDHYYNNIYTYALYLVKSDVIAEEIVQETFLKFWIKGFEVTKIVNIESFLITLARNRAMDILRRIKLEIKASQEERKSWTELHNETEEKIILNEGRRILEQAINQLPHQQKLVYELCYRRGMKYEEAAAELGISTETVKSYMKIALKSLRLFISKNTDLAVLAIIFKLF